MTLLELTQTLLNADQAPGRLRIAVIERDEQFWCGVPYGPRTSIRALAIQKLDEFVVEPERSAYIAWLQRNRTHWLAMFQDHSIWSLPWLARIASKLSGFAGNSG